MEKKHEFQNIKTQAACYDNDGRIYFFSNQFNALFVMNCSDRTLEFVTSFDRDPFFQESLYTKMLYYKNKVVLIPCVAGSITVYDTDTNETSYIFLEDDYLNYNVIEYDDDKVLLFPVKYRTWCWKLDLSIMEVRKIELDLTGYEDLLEERENICFIGSFHFEGLAYFAVYESDYFLVYNIEKNICSIKKTGNGTILCAAYKYENVVAFLSVNGTVIDIFNPSSDKWEEKIFLPYRDKRNIFSNDNLMAYTQLFSCGVGMLLCLPAFGNDFIIIKDGAISNTIEINWEKIGLEREDGQAFATIVEMDDDIMLTPYECDAWGKLKEQCLSSFSIEIKQNEFVKIMRKYRNKGLPLIRKDILYENEMTLKTFINCV